MIALVPDVSLPQILHRVAAMALVLGWYGAGATWLAARAGDPGPRFDGRGTLSPLSHLDVLGVLAAVLYRVAWMRPLAIDASTFRRPRIGIAFVVLGSTAWLGLLGVVALWMRPIVLTLFQGNGALALSGVFSATYDIAVTSALVNLLPIPPLVGGLWWGLVRPEVGQRAFAARYRAAGTAVLIVALVLGVFTGPRRIVLDGFRGLVGF